MSPVECEPGVAETSGQLVDLGKSDTEDQNALEQQVVAYLAMKGSYIDRMFVDPSQWRKGWGTRLVAFAKSLSPNGLELHTHQENRAARRLYEKHGFRAVKFGTSPPPESAPDVEYHWRPDNSAVHQTGALDP